MSAEETPIVCRQCGEVYPVEAENCPHCGKAARGTLGPVIGVVVGTLFVVSAVVMGSQLYVYGALGAVVAAFSGYLLYDKRRRLSEAASRGLESLSGSDESDESETIF